MEHKALHILYYLHECEYNQIHPNTDAFKVLYSTDTETVIRLHAKQQEGKLNYADRTITIPAPKKDIEFHLI